MRSRHRQAVRRRKSDRLIPLCAMDALESRQLFSGETLQTAIAPLLATPSNPAADAITLNKHFFDATLPGTLATFTTSLGTIQVGLTDAATPQTVANFLSYISSGSYTNTIFHRSVDLNTGLGATPSAPGTIIQGGGYSIMNGSIGHIAVNAAIPDEYQTEIYKDVAGTLAMAKTSQANSATSEWYFNVTDNTELDTPTVDSNGVTTSYTVFGTVISGMSVIDAIAALPTDSLGGGLDTVPVTGLSAAQISSGAAVTANNLIFTDSITSQAGTSYNVTSDNKTLVTPTVTNGVLNFTYGAGLSGSADITVVATNLDGTTASTTFTVTVPNTATPNTGPVTAPYSAPSVVTGSSGTFGVLADDTDSLAALNPSTVTIVTQPVHGTATVNSSTGFITYTPTSGYTGSDTLTYTVADSIGNVSPAGTVNLTVVPGPVTVSIGGKAGISLMFVQPDGVVGHLSVSLSTAVVTFTSYQVTLARHGGVFTATGPGATITNITVTNFPNLSGSVNVTSNGPVSLGSVDDIYAIKNLIAPNGTISGSCTFGGLSKMQVAAAQDATIDAGYYYPTSLIIPNVTNTNFNSTNGVILVKSRQWLTTGTSASTLTAKYISSLQVSGEFDEKLNLTSTGYSLFQADVGQATNTWGLAGSAFKLSLGTPGANWTLDSNGLVRTLAFKGNFVNQVTAAAITTLTVAGTTTGAVIQTDAKFSKAFNQIQHISFGGAVTNSVVFSAGNIGSISAPSFTNSRVYAGVNITVAQNGVLAASTSDFSDDARITSLSLGKGNAFSNSLISADIVGSLSLGKINTSNAGTVEGVAAHSIGSVTGTLVPGGILKATPADLKTAAALAAYKTKEKLAFGDFAINLL